MRRFLLIGTGLLLTLWSCKPMAMSKSSAPVESFGYAHFFSDTPQRLLFKARLQLAKEEFSGVLVVKETAPATYRSLFTTETGFKLFDLSIRNNGYTVNYGVGPIEKKFIAVRLAYTIQALLLRPFKAPSAVLLTGNEQTGTFLEDKHSYEIQKNGARVKIQTVYLKGKRKAQAHFSDFGSDDVPDSAVVNQFGFPLTASFHLLEQ